MGSDEGFDLVPALSNSAADQALWDKFLADVRKQYQNDPNMIEDATDRCIFFDKAECPQLEYEGYRFRRFSSDIVRKSSEGVAQYLEGVMRIAELHFGWERVKYWEEFCGPESVYTWDEVYANRLYRKSTAVELVKVEAQPLRRSKRLAERYA